MTNGFTKKRVGTLTLGEKLKKLRSDKRISLGEVSRVTKIRLEYLECLEEGRYQGLPADVYVRGFLKSYGEFLLVDEENLIRLYEKEKGIKKNLEKCKTGAEGEVKMKTINLSIFVFTPKKIALFLLPILVLALFFYLYREAGSLTDTPRLIILAPLNNSEVKENTVKLEGKTDKDVSVLVNDQMILVSDEGKFSENLSMQPGINIIHVRAVNKFQKETAENIIVQGAFEENNTQDEESRTDEETNLSSAQMDDTATQAVQIELNVSPGPVWVSVEADGNLVFSGEMLSGATQTFTAHDQIKIGSGMANATYVKLNGKDLGALGTESGVVRDVIFAKDGRK
jgi:cytoskeletal protein RodZ